jgi:predicted MFS family arabinose efflux permease
MSLGIAGGRQGKDHDRRFTQRLGWNQAASHAGNMTGAGLGGLLGSRYGLRAVFYLMISFAVATCVCALSVPRGAIDHRAARGFEEGLQHEGTNATLEAGTGHGADGRTRERLQHHEEESKPETLWELLVRSKHSKLLLIVAGAVVFFHLGNAAMLPFYGQALVAAGQGDPAGTTGLTVVIAQGTMMVTSLATAHAVTRGWSGYWMAMSVAFASLPVRAAVAGSTATRGWGLYPVQVLDGVGAGVQSVAVPGLTARVLAGSGRVNTGFGLIMTAHGAGSALSHVFAGWIAEAKGYSFALYILGVFPLVSLGLWVVFRGILKPAIDKAHGAEGEDGCGSAGEPTGAARRSDLEKPVQSEMENVAKPELGGSCLTEKDASGLGGEIVEAGTNRLSAVEEKEEISCCAKLDACELKDSDAKGKKGDAIE